ncbi:peptidylprolyl cis-trans isomerase PrsA1 [Lacticaseibacillus pantheris DSM 15945 = JCM 12539 = NBRC 106106]|uniref:Foldase protein PrsA n=2 Tax=Lacticaseibacillus pantheris TaxID=171523 RepID=A0A0R1U3V2_9LACO|nr:peptidylprolyl cis-trans isomerase PrsA1 [Lacticaseibacillus pantheris DSM 15945 = JCM 12539 = NBRC 106106]
MMKKWIVGVTTAAMALLLAGCGSSTVASMKGEKITQSEYYSKMKKSSAGQQVLQQMIVSKALEQQYGKKVSDKKVDKQYNTVKKQYGSSFAATLSSNGYTESSFKEQIKTSLLSEAALKDLKKPTTKQLKAQYKKYEPKVTVQHILVKKQDAAEQIVKDFQGEKNTTANFSALAKKNSIDTGTKSNGGKLPAFDNTDTSLDSTFKDAAFKLSKNGDFTTTPVKTEYGYSIIRMINNPGKGDFSSKKVQTALKDQLYKTWESDSTTMNKVIAKVLKKANVTIKDNDLKNVLSTYLDSSSSSNSAATTTGN